MSTAATAWTCAFTRSFEGRTQKTFLALLFAGIQARKRGDLCLWGLVVFAALRILHGHENPVAGFFRGLAELEHDHFTAIRPVADISRDHGIQVRGCIRDWLPAASDQSFRRQIIHGNELPIVAPLFKPLRRADQYTHADQP